MTTLDNDAYKVPVQFPTIPVPISNDETMGIDDTTFDKGEGIDWRVLAKEIHEVHTIMKELSSFMDTIDLSQFDKMLSSPMPIMSILSSFIRPKKN